MGNPAAEPAGEVAVPLPGLGVVSRPWGPSYRTTGVGRGMVVVGRVESKMACPLQPRDQQPLKAQLHPCSLAKRNREEECPLESKRQPCGCSNL